MTWGIVRKKRKFLKVSKILDFASQVSTLPQRCSYNWTKSVNINSAHDNFYFFHNADFLLVLILAVFQTEV